jgi:dihydrofolate reductase
MRKVVAYELLSLDGVAERPDKFVTEFDDVARDNLRRIIATQDAVLLGRRTYDEWVRYWPTNRSEPFASFINGVRNFVVTSTPLDLEWAGTTVVNGDVAGFVTDLKQQPGRDIGIHGSVSMTQSLLEADLVDRLRLLIAPSVCTEGRKLLELESAKRLSLTRSVASPAGHLLVDYDVKG